jgi:hypothetical protein
MNTFDQYKRKACRYCETPLPGAFLELGTMPLANSYVEPKDADKPEFECPLNLTWCSHCGLVQLTHIVPPQLMFSHYLYVTSTTKTFRDHFAQYAKNVREKLENVGRKKDAVCVDIGSNDGLLVNCYRNEGMKGVGVDPASNLAKLANENDIPTINRFFDQECVRLIKKEYGPAHAVSGNNVFAHIDDIHSVCRNVSSLLADDGLFVIEFPYLIKMLDELLFDMIYHEHVSYIAVTPLQFLMNKFGMEIFDIQQVSSHGGSLRVFSQKIGGSHKKQPIVETMIREEKARGLMSQAVYDKFRDDVNQSKRQFMEIIRKIQSEKKNISGYGVPAKANTIINFYGLTKKDIQFAVDDNPMKQNLLIPGSKIPIVPSAYLNEHPTDYVVIFAWNFAKEILQKLGALKEKGVKFLVPVKGAGKPDAAFSAV